MRKEIIVLANSKREGGRCVAGICQATGKWIRPIYKNADYEAIPKNKVKNINLLDVVEVYLKEKQPNSPDPYQRENWSVNKIDTEWKKIGQVKAEHMRQFCESKDEILHSLTEEVSFENCISRLLPEARKSLTLIETNVKFERRLFRNKEKWRGIFKDGQNNKLDLPITDPIAFDFLKKNPNLEEKVCMLCISLAKPMPEYPDTCYKLIAGIIWL